MSTATTRTGASAMVEQALALAARGWRVIPLAGKIPILKAWPTLATTDHEAIRAWWTTYPDANIGIATGKQSGLFVLDVDPGKGGDESLRALEEKFSALPQTIEALTGGGGRHLYFTHPGLPIGNSASALGPGLDIKTDGGQVVAPPSIHPTTKRAYEWEAAHHPEEVPLAEAPAWLLQQLTASTTTSGQGFTSPERILDGQRHDTLYKLSRSLKAKGLSRKAICDAVQAENQEKCAPPLPDTELKEILDSAWAQADRPAFTRNGNATHTDTPLPGPSPQPEADDLDLSETAGRYSIASVKLAVMMTFERLTDARGGVNAEVTVVLGATELLGGIDLSLKSDSGQTRLASSLKERAPTIQWKWFLQKSCSLVLRRHREGEPVIVLEPSDSIHVPFVVNPVIYKDHQALIFAPGGSLKSYLALFIALQASHGARVAGLSALRVPVLYLDWELNAETVGGRLKALQAGHPDLAEFVPYYRRCEAPLHQEVHQIARQVAERGVQLLIVDSVAMASGGDLASPDAAIKLQRALRMIGGASLVLAHTSKAIQEGQEKTAYGTVFFRELARNVWELQRADGDHPVRVALHQKKNNFGPTHAALGFEFTFSPDAVQITSCNPAEEPAFEDRLPIPSRIRNLLEDGKLRTARDIADDLNVKLVTIKSALSRGRGSKWQQIGEDYRNPQWTVLRAK